GKKGYREVSSSPQSKEGTLLSVRFGEDAPRFLIRSTDREWTEFSASALKESPLLKSSFRIYSRKSLLNQTLLKIEVNRKNLLAWRDLKQLMDDEVREDEVESIHLRTASWAFRTLDPHSSIHSRLSENWIQRQ